jgi:hypothetical protein
VKEFFLFCFLIAPAQAMSPPNPVASPATHATARQQPNHWRLLGLAMGRHQMLIIHAMRANGAELNPAHTPTHNRLDAFIARTDALLLSIEQHQHPVRMHDSDDEEPDCPCSECLMNGCIESQPEGCFRLCFRSEN